MMNTFTKENCRTLRSEIKTALKVVEDKYNVDINLGNVTFSEFEVSGKTTIKIRGNNGIDVAEKAFFEANARCYGLSPSDFGKSVTHNGIDYKIVGLKRRSQKKPIIIQDAHGKTYKASEDMIKPLLPKINV